MSAWLQTSASIKMRTSPLSFATEYRILLHRISQLRSIAQNYAVFIPQGIASVEAASQIELRYCDISSASGTGVGVEGGSVALTGCRIHDCKNHGVLYVGRSARGAVRRCSIEAKASAGISSNDAYVR